MSELGFSGGGNQTHPCTCAAPRIIVWNDCIAHCVDITGLIVLQPTPVPVPVAPPVEPTPVPVPMEPTPVPLVASVPVAQPQGSTLRPVAIIVPAPTRRPLQRVPLAVQPAIQAPSEVVVVLPPPSDDDDDDDEPVLVVPTEDNTVVIQDNNNNNNGASASVIVTDGSVGVRGTAGDSARIGVRVDNGNVQVGGRT